MSVVRKTMSVCFKKVGVTKRNNLRQKRQKVAVQKTTSRNHGDNKGDDDKNIDD